MSTTLNRFVKTSLSEEEVLKRLEQSFMSTVGGNIIRNEKSLVIKNGVNGVSPRIGADIDAVVNVVEQDDGYLLQCLVKKRQNATFTWCIILGLFVFFPWIVNIIYIFIDPSHAYNNALDMALMSISQTSSKSKTSSTHSVESGSSVKQQLKELKELLDDGLITEAEYNSKRNNILNKV